METKNLIIRDSIFSDCQLFTEWETSPEVADFFTMDDDRDYESVVKEYIDCDRKDAFLQMTLTLKPNEGPIGRLVISNINERNDSLKIARIYIANPEHRGKGYGTEAMKKVLEYVFLNLHMERVTITILPKSKTAEYFFDSLGFKDEGILRNAGKKNGRYFDLQLKSMIRAEYLDMRGSSN